MLFPFPADGASPLLIRYEWLTDVLIAKDDTEQRNKLRTGARRSIEFPIVIFSDEERVRFENFMIANQAKVIQLPVWNDATWLTTNVLATDSVLNVNSTNYREFEVGKQLAVILDFKTVVATIQSITAASITLIAPLGIAFIAGAYVVPVVDALLPPAQSFNYLNDSQTGASVLVRLIDEWIGTPVVESADYRGHPVMLDRTDWGEDITAEISRALAVFDNNAGVVSFFDTAMDARTTRSHRFLMHGRNEISNFKNWLAARQGRYVTFWYPSNQNDITVRNNISSSATTLSVNNCGHTSVKNEIGRRDIMIKTKSGVRYYRRITNVVETSSSVETITINAALGASVAVSDIESVSYMRLVRLASDTIEVAFETDNIAASSLSFQGVNDTNE